MSVAANIPQRGTVEYLEYIEGEIVRLENNYKDRDYLESETRDREKRLEALHDYRLSPGLLVSENQHHKDGQKWTWYDHNKVTTS